MCTGTIYTNIFLVASSLAYRGGGGRQTKKLEPNAHEDIYIAPLEISFGPAISEILSFRQKKSYYSIL